MKRKLLLICGLITTAFLSTSKAQDFDLDFWAQFQGSTSLANGWKNGGVAAAITKNGISAWIESANQNRWAANNTETANGIPYLRFQGTHDEAIIYLTSTQPLRKMAFQYRGTTNDNVGNIKLTYGVEPNDLFAETKILTPVISATPPGNTVFVDFDPAAGIKWVKIQRGTISADGTGAQSPGIKLYRFAASTTNFTVLPLEFLSFTAKTGLGNAVNLNWSTAKEVNTKEFIIERGTTTGDFKAIGSLASSNTAGTHTYSFVDETATAGKAYYRIKQVDNDGKFAYSDVTQVTVKGGGISLSAYPNPTSDVLTVSYAAARNASLKVVNAQGQSVISLALSAGASSSKLNVASLATGIYYVVLSNDGSQSSVKFVKN